MAASILLIVFGVVFLATPVLFAIVVWVANKVNS